MQQPTSSPMIVSVHTHHIALPPHAGLRLKTRVVRTLNRFADGIAQLELTLKDTTGRRGQRDKLCMLKAKLANGRQIIVIDRSAKLPKAFVSCLRRSRALIARELKRRRRHRHPDQKRLAATAAFSTEPQGAPA